MKKANELRRGLLTGALMMLLATGLFWAVSLTGQAAGQATVTAANGAKIRREAATTSDMIGGAEKGKVLEILSQVQGSDGYTWYQVKVNDTTTGYVRSDIVSVSGDVPAGGTGEGGEGGETVTPPPVEVTQVNPVSATVTGADVKIRDTASNAGQELGTVPDGTAVTVTGTAADAEGYTWYQVSYNAEGTDVSGFVLSDNCTPSGELTPLGQEPTEPEPEPPKEPAPYELVEKDGSWLLVDNVNNPGYGYPVVDLFQKAKETEELYHESEATVKKQKIIIIVLVFLLVGAVAGIAFLVFKIRDAMDSAYFNEVEKETLRRKGASGGSGRQKVAMHTVGAEKQEGRPTGTRPATRGGSPVGQGSRPAGAAGRAGAASDQRTGGVQGRPGQSVRPAGSGMQRDSASGQRPVGGARPAGTSGGVQGQRTMSQGQRPGGPVQRSAGTSQSPRRPEGPQGRPSQGVRPQQGTRPQRGPEKAQPKNFLTDDDEFEFEFLNYEDDDVQ